MVDQTNDERLADLIQKVNQLTAENQILKYELDLEKAKNDQLQIDVGDASRRESVPGETVSLAQKKFDNLMNNRIQDPRLKKGVLGKVLLHLLEEIYS